MFGTKVMHVVSGVIYKIKYLYGKQLNTHAANGKEMSGKVMFNNT
jgi:hypothetical protein